MCRFVVLTPFFSEWQQMVTDAIKSIEVLDGALKKRRPVEECKLLAEQAAGTLEVVIGSLEKDASAEDWAAQALVQEDAG